MTAFAKTVRGAVLTTPLLILLAACVTTKQEPSPEALAILAKAEQGDVEAQFKAGTLYDWGRGLSRDGSEAKKWYSRAAEAGLAEAQNSMGSVMLAEKRYEEARFWYEKAAAQNHAVAVNGLGYLYDLGLGVPQDRRKAFELYTRAADLGEPEAMWNMAVMYDQGQIGRKDGVMACVWARRAFTYAKAGDPVLPVVNRALANMNRTMPVEMLGECNDKVASWQPSKTR